MIEANNPALTSWVNVPANSDFPIQNLPFGIVSGPNGTPRAASRIGDKVIDLAKLASAGIFEGTGVNVKTLQQPTLNDFIAQGKTVTRAVRNRLSEVLRTGSDKQAIVEQTLSDVDDVKMLMPVFVRDYTDFYSSREHATNVGTMFRDPENALLPNWLHLPVGYHGRASSIVVSGTDIRRPKGQQIPADSDQPVFGPSKLLDFELEMAFVVGQQTELGSSIPVDKAEDYIFGLVLFNDWSARDIQKWEYVPLGPFLAKSFASSVSPWIVTLDALDPFRIDNVVQDNPAPLPYLKSSGQKRFDVNLEVALQPAGGEENTICRSNFKYMYWNMSQQLAHHTVNGCNVNVGDMMASGTISGTTPDSYGSMLELSWRGSKPLKLSDGSERKFVLDGDTIVMRGYGEKDGVRIGFGEVRTKVLPAN